MTSERREKRSAYEMAKAVHRALHERYYPVQAMGSRPAELVTPEALAELERLRVASEDAKTAWDASVRS